MPIVTIVSDLGNDSYSLAALKGTLYSKANGIHQIIDISNEIRNFDIVEGAFVFANAFKYFPKGTIHLLSINPFYNQNYQMLCVETEGQYILVPNHGILPLIFDQEINGKLVLLNGFDQTTDYFSLLGETINALINGTDLEQLGQPDPEIFRKIALQPVISKNIIRGTIIHVDRFGNLISNITRTTFERIKKDRDFAVYFRHKDPIRKISRHYHDVAVGDELCLFNMSNHMEIAINLGNASHVLGLHLDDTIQIDFYD